MKDPLPWPDKPAGWQEKTGGYAKDMTLRDYFAAKAMQGMCAGLKSGDRVEHMPKFAYLMADAMLEARNAAQ